MLSGVGLFVVGDDPNLAEAALAVTRASLVTLLAADALGGCQALTREAIAYLERWEVERFRRRVASG
jgi:rhamnose utilization protein RhaD (predicted bifunctional aldolase and dehydrogenase)